MIIGKAEMLMTDCMEYMATLPDKAFDLAIVDPPYGIGVGATVGGGSPLARKVRVGGRGLSSPKFIGGSMILESPKKNTLWSYAE